MSGRKREARNRPGTPSPRRETSAGGVVVRVTEGRPLVLLIRDSYGNWGFPKGHLKRGERPEVAAVREVMEETGLRSLVVRAPIAAIDWVFTWRGSLIQKKCHFFLMETTTERTTPQAAEGIIECRWSSVDDAQRLIRYANARAVLRQAEELVRARDGAAVAREG